MQLQAETAEDTIQRRVLPMLAKHFLLFYFITIVVAALACYHKIFDVLPHPVVSTGITTKIKKTYQRTVYYRGHKSTTTSFARIIRFNYNGQVYDATGGWDEEMNEGVKVKLLFNANNPENAYELSAVGLIDFPVFANVVTIWILISGLLFAFASSDSHFTAFNFKLPILTVRAFICMLIITLCIPLYSSADLLLFGKKADDVMTGDFNCQGGTCVNAIVFTAAGNQYATYSQYANEYEEGVGNHFPIIYQPGNPNRCCIYQFSALYSNNYVILMIFALLVIVPWFIISRTDN